MPSDWWIIHLAKGPERLRDKLGNKAHSTQIPVALLYRIILSSSNPGDLIFDPFMGSGTVGEVSLRLKRKFVGYELNPQFCKLSNIRLQTINGIKD